MADDGPGVPGAGLVQWLCQRGVKLKAAHEFVKEHRCLNANDASLLLRFELAPLHLANSDSINEDMKRLFKCSPKVAKRIIEDLDVISAHSQHSLAACLHACLHVGAIGVCAGYTAPVLQHCRACGCVHCRPAADLAA